MTRESFIRKWLANPQKQYNEQCRDEMRDDLDLVIEAALHQPLVSGELNCEHDWLVDMYDHFGFPASKFCDKCSTRKAI